MKKTSMLKTTMKKLLLFLPLFFAAIAIGMDKQNPPRLQYLAAAKVPKNQIGKLRSELQSYTYNIQNIAEYVKREKERAEFFAYKKQLEQLCTRAENFELFKEIYASNPFLIQESLTAAHLLNICIIHNNTTTASWLFERFPELKKDSLMATHLSNLIKINNWPMARYIIANNEYYPLYTSETVTHALENKEGVNLLMPYIIKEIQREATYSHQNRPNTSATAYAIYNSIYAEKFSILEHIFLNYPEITNACQKMFCEMFANFLSDIQYEYHPRNIDKCKFIAKFLNEPGKREVQQLLDRKLIKLLEAEYCYLNSVKAVLELGANRLVVNNTGKIPLQILLSASIVKSIKMDDTYHYYLAVHLRKTAEALLSAQAREQVCIIDDEGNTALHYPSAGIVIDLLEENGGDMKRVNNNGQTPLSAFFVHNFQAFLRCNHSHFGYDIIFTKLFINYLSMPISPLSESRPEVLKHLSHLEEDNYFKKNVLQVLQKRLPQWHQHTPTSISNAIFVASSNKKITAPENSYEKFFSLISSKLTNPKIPTYNSLYHELQRRASIAHDQSIPEKIIVDRMEDVD